jgi:alpha-glucosidase (family GH31 glycosyl hydrolase)
MKIQIPMLPDELWWGGTASQGPSQPYDATTQMHIDLATDSANQTAPLYLSSKGRYIWGDSPLVVTMQDGTITVEGEGVVCVEAGDCLRDAYLAAMRAHFSFEQKELPEVFFRTAQYNTWMEFTYNPTQEKVLAYAHAIVDNGYTPGVLMIDEGWHTEYGLWEFDFVKFPDPVAMVKELHALGFVVMLWITPYINAAGRNFIDLADPWISEKLGREYVPHLLRTTEGDVALMRWWNGYSAMLDLTTQNDIDYLDARLHHLMDAYGIDGFKCDGGSIGGYGAPRCANGTPCKTAQELNLAWNAFGARYTYHEYKDTYGRGGKACIQRIMDRGHRWDGDGLQSLLPFALTQGLLGYPYICPDMVGGGEWTFSDKEDFHCDEELFVRMAQCGALFPMMQFSWAPWRMLSAPMRSHCLAAAKLHASFADRIVAEVERARKTGEPILRSMEYAYPHCGYARICDQFMLGESLLVAPVVEKGAVTRTVELPEGAWRAQDGAVYMGGGKITVDAPIDTLPYFELVD